MESMLVNQNLQYSLQPLLVAVMLFENSKTFKDFKDEIQERPRTDLFKYFQGLKNERKNSRTCGNPDLAVLVQYPIVTDGRTDGQTER